MHIWQGKGSTDFVSLNHSCISCRCTQPLWYLREQWSQHLQHFPSKYDLLHTEHLSSESSDVFLFYPFLSRSFSFWLPFSSSYYFFGLSWRNGQRPFRRPIWSRFFSVKCFWFLRYVTNFTSFNCFWNKASYSIFFCYAMQKP